MCGRYVRRSDKQRIAEHFAFTARLCLISGRVGMSRRRPSNLSSGSIATPESASSCSCGGGLFPSGQRTRASDSARSMRKPKRLHRARIQGSDPFPSLSRSRGCFLRMAEAGPKDQAAVRDRDERWTTLCAGRPMGEMEGPQGRRRIADVTVITTDPNKVVQPLHDRMPVIIPERDYDRWLKADPGRPPIDLLRPFDADKMTAWKVDKAVGNVKNDSPALIEPASAVLEPSEDRSPEAPGSLLAIVTPAQARLAWRGPFFALLSSCLQMAFCGRSVESFFCVLSS